MLVACIVEGKCLAQSAYRLVASRLRPTVGIEIRVKSSANPSVDVSSAAKDGLGKSRLEIGIRPILAPCVEKLQLAFAQKNRFRNIYGFRVVLRIANMVRTRPLLGDHSRRTGLELAVLDYGETDATPI